MTPSPPLPLRSVSSLAVLVVLASLVAAAMPAFAEPVATSTVPGSSSPGPAVIIVGPETPADSARPEAGAETQEAQIPDSERLDLDRTGTPPLPSREPRPPPAPVPPGEDRPLPAYDGREPPPPGAAEVLIWIPRTIFFPVNVVLDYGLRWPMSAGITAIERYKILERVMSLFTFREGKSGLFPTVFFDFGLKPSVGFYLYNDDLFYEGHSFAIQGGFWKDNWVRLSVKDSWRVFGSDSGVLFIRGEYLTRPDDPFHGIGFASRQQDETFFRWRRADAELGLRAILSGLNRVSFSLRYRDADQDTGQSPSIDTRFDPTRIPGFSRYRLLVPSLSFEIDTRDPERAFTAGTGLRFDAFGSFAFDPNLTERNFFRWGAEAAAFWDMSGMNHVLGFHLYAEFLEPTGTEDIPMPELITLGGPEHLRGFLYGRFRGTSAITATVDYRYPIWTFLDANLFVGIGNAFADHLDDFRWERLVLDFGLGVRTNFSRETSLDILLAFGTNRFESDEFEIDHTRFVFGLNHGF